MKVHSYAPMPPGPPDETLGAGLMRGFRHLFEPFEGSPRMLEHPYLSPLNGDFTKGFPPTILTTGTRDLLLSDTVRMHRALRRAGVAAELHVTEAGGHGGFLGMAPEDHEIMAETRRFVQRHWSDERSHLG